MLKNRILTASILAPLAILAILLLPDLWFALVWGIAIAVCAWEWSDLSGLASVQARAAFTAVCVGLMTSYQQWAGETEEWLAWPVIAFWLLFSALARKIPSKLVAFNYPPVARMAVGLFVLVTAWILMVWTQHNLGPKQLLYLFLLVWLADIAAYFTGKRFGLTKLAPDISPGKTVEGLYGALVAVALFALLTAGGLYWAQAGSFLEFSATQVLDFVMLSVVTVFFSVVGDLFESLAKRVRGVKDSGAILPGHGGLLDRLDSLIAAVSVYYAGSKLLGVFFQ
ncbi:MAG: phosphatidate cytidylyltransferase [Candidatus Methylumidiphilus sp.]